MTTDLRFKILASSVLPCCLFCASVLTVSGETGPSHPSGKSAGKDGEIASDRDEPADIEVNPPEGKPLCKVSFTTGTHDFSWPLAELRPDLPSDWSAFKFLA